jgi:hypothetical protein
MDASLLCSIFFILLGEKKMQQQEMKQYILANISNHIENSLRDNIFACEFENYLRRSKQFYDNAIAIHKEVFHGINLKEKMNSCWELFIIELSREPDYHNLAKLHHESVLTQEDWDGLKTKKGASIIRRNGEIISLGIVIVYALKDGDYTKIYNYNKDNDMVYYMIL